MNSTSNNADSPRLAPDAPSLEDLVACITPDNLHPATSWEEPVVVNLLVAQPGRETLGDVLACLGNITPERVVLPPHEGPATEEDVLYWEEQATKRLCELVSGVLVEKAMGWNESCIAAEILFHLSSYLRSHRIGIVTGSDGMIKLFPGRVRIPDVAVYLKSRFPKGRLPKEPIPNLAPNLAVEVLSVSNTRWEMELKRQDYFGNGVELVWEVDPPAQQVTIYTSLTEFHTLTIDDVLDGGAVLPGFSLAISAIFAEPDFE